MSYLPFGGVTIDGEVNIAQEGHQFDAYGRMRISNVTTLFESQLTYNKQDNLWHTIKSGSATDTFLPNQSSLNLSVTATVGDKAIRQSKVYTRARLGKSQLVFLSGNLGAAVDGITKKIGYFDNDNGVYIQTNNLVTSLVVRSKASGSVTETVIPQTSWNIDQLNGSGPSTLTADITKDQVFVFDIEWMGTGKVRAGLLINGDIVYIHEFRFTNSSTDVYMTTASLPARFEIENVTGANTATLKETAVAIMTEGEGTGNLSQHSISNNVTPTTCNTALKPILSIKPKGSMNSIVNRAVASLRKISVFGVDRDIYFEIKIGGTLTSPMWNSVSSESSVNYDVSSTSISGGRVITSGFLSAGSVEKMTDLDELEKMIIATNYDGTDGTILTLCAKTLYSNSDVFTSFVWTEEY